MSIKEVLAAFFSGLVVSPFVNTFFPLLVTTFAENFESLRFPVDWIFRAIPLVLLLPIFLGTVRSYDSLAAAVFGIVFSVWIFGGLGVADYVALVAIFFVVLANNINLID